MTRVAAALEREAAALVQEDTARAAREKTTATAYLKGVQRAGARIPRMPAGDGLLSGEDRGTREPPAPSRQTASGAPISALAGLADIGMEAVRLPFATLTPPFALAWTWTKQILIAPGTLVASADKAAGTCGFEIASSHDSHQVNKSRARAAIGVVYRPTERGVLGIRPVVNVERDWYLKWNMRVAHAYGWSGMLVQSFNDADDALASTPIDKKRKHFDLSGGGSPIPPVEVYLNLPPEDFWGTSLFVDPSRWYAIWIWCGGGIRAAGWQTVLGVNVGSDASAQVAVSVSRIALYFTPVAALGRTAPPLRP